MKWGWIWSDFIQFYAGIKFLAKLIQRFMQQALYHHMHFHQKGSLISQRVDETSTVFWSRSGNIKCSNADNDRSFISAFTLQSRDIYTALCEEKNPFGQEIASPCLHIVSWLERLWQIKKKYKKQIQKEAYHRPPPPDFVPHHKGWQWLKRELHKFLILRLDSYLLFKSPILIEFWSFCLNVLSHVSFNAPLNEVLCVWPDTLRRTDYLFRQWLNFLSPE